MRPGTLLFLLLLSLSVTHTIEAAPDTLKILVIGNSFSINATEYLDELASDGGHNLVIGKAEIGGCSLQKHWELAEIAEKDPGDPQGRPYRGKSLREKLREQDWDIVTFQQVSHLSCDPQTYAPYAQKLHDLIKEVCPEARVVMHQTWAYRSDARKFCQTSDNIFAKNDREMWRESRKAYRAISNQLRMEVIPVGDAFHKVSASRYGFKKDPDYNYDNMVNPELPDQQTSLHKGYFHDKDGKLQFDGNHASTAGCYLGGLVWYSFLFDESPSKLKFTPGNVPEELAGYFRNVADKVVK